MEKCKDDNECYEKKDADQRDLRKLFWNIKLTGQNEKNFHGGFIHDQIL